MQFSLHTVICFSIFCLNIDYVEAHTIEEHCISCHGEKSSMPLPHYLGDVDKWKQLIESKDVQISSKAKAWIEPMYRQIVDRGSMPPAHIASGFRNSEEEQELVSFLTLVRPEKVINQKPVGQILPSEAVKRYRSMLPKVRSSEITAILQSPSTFFYDERVMPQAYIDDEDSIQGYLQTTDSIAQDRTSVISNGKFRFPFGHTAGMHKALGTHFNFLYLPTDGQRTLPVAITQGGRRWVYPEGAYLGEVLYQKNKNGELVFEVRVSWKENGAWKYDIFRPFVTADQLLRKISELKAQPGYVEDRYLTSLESHLNNPTTLQVDNLHEASSNFNGVHPRLTAALDLLPPLTEQSVRSLLNTTFTSAMGAIWRRDEQRNLSSFAPTGSTSAHIAPYQYAGHFFSIETSTCNRCHLETRRSLDTFFPGNSSAFSELASYGTLWEPDQKFSFFPLSSHTGELPRRIEVSHSLLGARYSWNEQ